MGRRTSRGLFQCIESWCRLNAAMNGFSSQKWRSVRCPLGPQYWTHIGQRQDTWFPLIFPDLGLDSDIKQLISWHILRVNRFSQNSWHYSSLQNPIQIRKITECHGQNYGWKTSAKNGNGLWISHNSSWTSRWTHSFKIHVVEVRTVVDVEVSGSRHQSNYRQ
jgi:hypothetical protein